jgi:UDP-N-acetylmuramoyl-tripeptide--D-alanyl-D-alanine ligase
MPVAVATGYSIDSRTIRPGEVFFAVRGVRDGHAFVDAAIAAGAAAAVVARGPLKHIGRLLLVPDPQAALQRLATQVRNRWGGRVVAITGSNGKTTTKEITAALIGTRFRVAKTEGNLNNELGLPLSLLRMNEDAEVGVMEIGMNHAGEIRALAAVARPEVGVVTNVGPAHLEFFHSVDDIALAKRELIESLPETGVAVLNADDPRVRRFEEAHRGRVVTFGIQNAAEVRVAEVEEMGLAGTQFRLEGAIAAFHTPLAGRHNLYNTLAGIAAAWALGIAPESLRDAVANLRPAPMRGEVIELGDIRIINDCYNSNPRAAEMMLELLAKTPARRRVAVLGEMLELGERSEDLHREVGRRAAELKIDLLAGVRGAAKALVDGARTEGLSDRAAYFFEDVPQAAAFLKSALEPGDVVLLKASRGVKLERAMEVIRAES